ncbi:oligosaccharide repeat unit polymerase [Mycoplasmatota bacterium]|nr:oligosaccharide repeat unit polymerase [Mycoplasmatota bacterium]
MKKLSKFALTTLIIQTILTLGLNWVFFLIYYRLFKYSFLSTNKVNYEVSHIDLFFNKDCKKLSIISIVTYFIFILFSSFTLLLINDTDFFYILNFQLWSFVKGHFLDAILLSVIIFLFLTYAYKILIKNVYFNIYKKNHVYFNNYSELDLVSFIIISILTLGWFYILYLFTLGIYELYLYWINKYNNKTNYYFSTFGIISLFLIGFMNVILVYYLVINHVYFNFISLYLIILFMLNTILSYGFFEFKMRKFLNGDLIILNKNQDKIFKPYINKKILLLCSFIIFVSLFYSIYRINDLNELSLNTYDNINIANLKCEQFDSNSICFNRNLNMNNEEFSIWTTPIASNQNYKYHQQLIVSMIRPSEIKNEAIQTSYKVNDVFYTSPGQVYAYENAYIFVQTYYKRISKNYVPVFNIVKNLELVTEINDIDIHLSILDNNVYIYDFMSETFSKYDRNYNYIDTTRLMIDNLNISIKSNHNNLYGYHIANETTSLHIVSNNIEKLKFFISYINPFVYDELVFYLHNSFSQISQEERYHRTDVELLTFRVLRNTKHISYYNDRFYLYMDNIADINHSMNLSYINSENNELIEYLDKEIDQIPKVLTNQINVKYLNKQSRILYTDNYDVDFPVNDNKIISLFLEGDHDFSGTITFDFSIKSIKQYFDNENITHETLTINN